MDDARRRFLRGRPAVPPTLAVNERCLNLRAVECRLCADACEPRALRFQPAPGGVARLVLNPSLCTGCGDCVPLCPVAAITVRAVPA